MPARTTSLSCITAALVSIPPFRYVGTYLCTFVITSFHACGAMDRTCFSRMRKRRKWSYAYFHAGNVVIHWLPAAYGWWVCVEPPSVTSLLLAIHVMLAWCAIERKDAMFCHNDIYVPLPKRTWYLAHCIGVMSMCGHYWLMHSWRNAIDV